MSEPITDHLYQPEQGGGWYTGRCDRCGEPKKDHARPTSAGLPSDKR